jgi:hypothetical protein
MERTKFWGQISGTVQENLSKYQVNQDILKTDPLIIIMATLLTVTMIKS